jgi:putative addiction module component (TIGR02574 family)
MSLMSISGEAVLDSALKLPSKDRARIAAELIASLDGIPDAGAEAAWDAEVERRIEQVEQGKVQLLGWNDVKAEVARGLLVVKAGRKKPQR